MAGIQISGLLSNQAFDWKSVVDQLMEVEATPVKKMQAEQTSNDDKIAALEEIRSSLEKLQDSVQAMRSGNVFTTRTISSDNGSTSWKSSSAAGAPVGSYKFAIQQLATATRRAGGLNVGAGISSDADVTDVTLSTMRTAAAVKAGTFTINGQQVTVALTDSLQDVFDHIATATGNTVTGSYDPSADKVTLSSASPITVGAGNDTSNFLQVLKLGNNGTGTVTSSAALGVVKTTAAIASSGLATLPTAVDGSGNGTFNINNVAIAYNINTDTISSVLAKITQSAAGVTATYDPTSDRFTLVNKNTGDAAINLSESAGGLLAAFGLNSGGETTTNGKNALFSVNDGPTITSSSNTLDAAAHGITGLSVTVNTESTETLTVESDTGTMQTAIQNMLDAFNAAQDLIESKTKITTTAGKVSTSVLSSNREVQEWGRQLQKMAFEAVTGVTGSVKTFDNLGIDFDGTTGHLMIKDQGKLSTALANTPDDVQGFFVSGSYGMVPQMYGYLTTLMTGDLKQQDSLRASSLKIDEQISTLQARLDQQREMLTNSFIKMLDAQSKAESQNTALTNAFFKKSSD